MKTADLILVITILLLAASIFSGLLIYFRNMNRHSLKKFILNNPELPLPPEHFLNLHKIWYASFVSWTSIYLFISLGGLLCSLAAVFFAALDGELSRLVIVFSLLASFFTMTNIILMPQARANGFYKARAELEHEMLRFIIKNSSGLDAKGVHSLLNQAIKSDDYTIKC